MERDYAIQQLQMNLSNCVFYNLRKAVDYLTHHDQVLVAQLLENLIRLIEGNLYEVLPSALGDIPVDPTLAYLNNTAEALCTDDEPIQNWDLFKEWLPGVASFLELIASLIEKAYPALAKLLRFLAELLRWIHDNL